MLNHPAPRARQRAQDIRDDRQEKVPSGKRRDTQRLLLKYRSVGFPGSAVVESLPANAGDTGSSPDLGRSHMPRSD